MIEYFGVLVVDMWYECIYRFDWFWYLYFDDLYRKCVGWDFEIGFFKYRKFWLVYVLRVLW